MNFMTWIYDTINGIVALAVILYRCARGNGFRTGLEESEMYDE